MPFITHGCGRPRVFSFAPASPRLYRTSKAEEYLFVRSYLNKPTILMPHALMDPRSLFSTTRSQYPPAVPNDLKN